MAQVSWKDAIVEVLTRAGEAMHYKSIAEEIVSQNLRKKPWGDPSEHRVCDNKPFDQE